LRFFDFCATLYTRRYRSNGRRLPPEKGVMRMITWAELFGFCLVVIGVVSLIIQAYRRK